MVQQPTYKKLKDLRDSFGFSENGFRLYERSGLLRCFRNEENGYRSTTLGEGIRLSGSYNLVRSGFSIKEVNELIDKPLEEYVEQLADLNASMTRELQSLIARKSRLERQVRSIRSYLHSPDACTIVKAPSILLVPLHDEHLRFYEASRADASMWNQALPLVDVSMVADLKGRRAISATYGPSAERGTALANNLPVDHAVEFCRNGTSCLHAYVSYPAGELPDENAYHHVFSYLDSHGLAMEGFAVLHLLLDLSGRDETAQLDEVLVPLAEPTGQRRGRC